jgi:hypothetical protein
MASVPPSRPDQIRQVFRENPNTILTRAQVIARCLIGFGGSIENETKHLSMSLSRMWYNGEFKKYKLSNMAGFCRREDDPFIQ